MTTEDPKELKSIFKADHVKFALDVKITQDNLKLFIDVTPTGNNIVERKDLLDILQNQFPSVEFDKAVLDEICKLSVTSKAILKRRIARGYAAEPGIDGKLLILVKAYSGTGTPGFDSHGKFSLSSLNLFDNVAIDQVVARVYPPKSGKDGKDVLGKVIKSPVGVPVKVSLDKSLQLLPGPGPEHSDQTYDRIVAKSEGMLINKKNDLSIKDTLEIKGDVDFHCGNIDFYGTVVIQGDVLPGFSVIGRKGIVIKGSLQKGSLRSEQGDIEIKGFAIGGSDSNIFCAGQFTANILHEIKAEVLGKIIINKEAVDCDLRCHKYISAPNGRILGGHFYVVHGMEAKEVGNDVGQSTNIRFSTSAEISSEYSVILANISSHIKTIQLLELHIGPYVAQSSRIQLLNSPLKEKMLKMLRKLKSVQESLKKLEAQKDQMISNAQLDPLCRLNAKSKINQGVVVAANKDSFSFQDLVAGPISVVYDIANNKFITEPLKDITCPDGNLAKKVSKNGKK